MRLRPPGRRAAGIAAALAIVYVVWGSTYLGIAVAIETLPPLLMGGARFLVAGAVLYAFAARREAGGDRPGRAAWLAACASGTLLFAVGNGGVILGQRTVPSGVAALLIASVPLWIALLDRLFFGARLGPRALVGLALGFAGVALLAQPSGSGFDPVGVAFLLVAPVGWAAGSLVTRGAPLPRGPLVAAAMQMLAGGAVLTVAGLVSGEAGEIGAVSARSAVAFAYLVLLGSLVAFTAYSWLLRVARTSLVATYAYVNPVVAVALGWLVLAESITALTLVSGAVIVVAVALIVSAPAAREARDRDESEAVAPGPAARAEAA